MKYKFPIRVNLRKFLPSAEKALASIEATFRDITREDLNLVVTSQILTLTVDSPVLLTTDQINLFKATTLPLLIEKFPDKDIEIGEPTVEV